MKNKPVRKTTRRNQARSVPGPSVVYRFLRRRETLFVAAVKSRQCTLRWGWKPGSPAAIVAL
jgi:hypothetical protein